MPNPGSRPDDDSEAARIEEIWRSFLIHGEPPGFHQVKFLGKFIDFRHLMRRLPAEPRCRFCYVPFKGPGGRLAQTLMGMQPSKLNPQMCNACEQFAQKYPGGVEVELSLLFADVRGSTTLAEGQSPAAFSTLINRFYQTATDVLVKSDAIIEKLIGDEVVGVYVPGYAGPDHARVAIEAAQAILRATGHGQGGEPWIPVGIGVHTGLAFMGSVGHAERLTDITVLGDAPNTAARIAAQAKTGEVLVSKAALAAAGMAGDGWETRHLQLKGKSEPVDAWVLEAASSLPPAPLSL